MALPSTQNQHLRFSRRRNRLTLLLGIASLATLAWTTSAKAQSVPADPGKQWNATYTDDFNTGSSDLSGWTFESGNNNGWGNGELESYTSNSSNVSVSGGSLHIDAVGTTSGANTTYTSARMRNDAVFNQAYGLIEFRAKLPAGQGLWPALWMMPKSSVYGAWPSSGEMDVMESTGQDTSWVAGSLHSGTDSAHEDNQTAHYQPGGGFNTTAFHTYDLKWTAGSDSSHPATLKFYVDGNLYETQSGGWVVPSSASNVSAPFDQPFFLIMDLAVGGNFVGGLAPGAGTYDMQVDYVHVFQSGALVPEPAATSLILLASAGAMVRRRRPVTR